MSTRSPSPLRYPGGKSGLASALKQIIYFNRLQDCVYAEPFGGGAGAGLKLLDEGHVAQVLINDRDRAVYSFWRSIMRHCAEFVQRIMTVDISITEWRRQREIYRSGKTSTGIDLGFAAFYLNRCNRSGIIRNGGPIGGIEQAGSWNLGARFNREELAARVEHFAAYGDRIIPSNDDAIRFIQKLRRMDGRIFVFADPPYYVKSRELYLNHYKDKDHELLAGQLRAADSLSWVLTYDDVPRIRELYSGFQMLGYTFRYSAHTSSRSGGELMVAPTHVAIPTGLGI